MLTADRLPFHIPTEKGSWEILHSSRRAGESGADCRNAGESGIHRQEPGVHGLERDAERGDGDGMFNRNRRTLGSYRRRGAGGLRGGGADPGGDLRGDCSGRCRERPGGGDRGGAAGRDLARIRTAEYPAVPDFGVTAALLAGAGATGRRVHAGVVQSKDSFYGQHSPARMPTAAALAEKWEAWRRLGVLASEMEAAALFTVGAARGLRTGAVFHVIWNQERAAAGLDTDADESHDTSAAVRAAVEAIRKLSEKPD